MPSAHPEEAADLDQFAALFAETGPAPIVADPIGTAPLPPELPVPPELITPPVTAAPAGFDPYDAVSPEPQVAPSPTPQAPVSQVPVERPDPGPTPLGRFDLPEPIDPRDLARSTVGEKITVAAAVLVPPLGLIAAIVAAARSRSRRGWVIGLLRVALVLGVVTTVIAAFGGVAVARALEAQRAHAAVEAASAEFCTTIAKQPDMATPPTFGWPKPAASIPDSIAAMQTYADRWTALAKVSPAGIRADVKQMAAAATQVIESVTVSRTVDDASNISVMTQAASTTAIPQWVDDYCK